MTSRTQKADNMFVCFGSTRLSSTPFSKRGLIHNSLPCDRQLNPLTIVLSDGCLIESMHISDGQGIGIKIAQFKHSGAKFIAWGKKFVEINESQRRRAKDLATSKKNQVLESSLNCTNAQNSNGASDNMSDQ